MKNKKDKPWINFEEWKERYNRRNDVVDIPEHLKRQPLTPDECYYPEECDIIDKTIELDKHEE